MVPAQEAVSAHLESRYDIKVADMSRPQPWCPFVYRVDREDGPPWIARVFMAARPVERLEGDAEILRLLRDHGYPSERLAHEDPVSTLDGSGVMVTEYVEGELLEDFRENVHTTELHDTLRALGELLGRLHVLPAGQGAAGRAAGSWHGDLREGFPCKDIAGGKALLERLAGDVPDEHRARYDSLREQLATADHCHDLPLALIHPDFAGPNVILKPEGGPVVIDWTSAGRGPRIASLAWLLNWAPRPECVDAIVDGYRVHVTLTDDELARLADVMRVRPLYFACRSFRHAIRSGRAPSGDGKRYCSERDNEIRAAKAARVRHAFKS